MKFPISQPDPDRMNEEAAEQKKIADHMQHYLDTAMPDSRQQLMVVLRLVANQVIDAHPPAQNHPAELQVKCRQLGNVIFDTITVLLFEQALADLKIDATAGG